MKNAYFEYVILDLMRYKHKLIYIEKVKSICQKIMKEEYNDKRMYKMIYYLKARWYLAILKKNIYFVKKTDEDFSENYFLEKFYRRLLKEHCWFYLKSNRYVWWISSLEIIMDIDDISDDILIINPIKQSSEIIIFDKKVSFKRYMNNDKNLFGIYKKYILNANVWGVWLKHSCLELAILESLYNISIVNKWYVFALIRKILKKNKDKINLDIIIDIVRHNKHHSSVNRLYEITKDMDLKLAGDLFELIKKYSYLLW